MAAPYQGLSVADALAEHAAEVKEILAAAQAFLKEQNDAIYNQIAVDLPLDEVTVLKYWLSARRKKEKAVEVAVARIKGTFEFRKEYAASMHTARSATEFGGLVPCVVTGFVGDELVTYSHYGKADFNEIKDKFGTTEACFAEAVIQAEQLRLVMDRRTRDTGRLCKLLHLVDFQGLSVSKASNITVIRAFGRVSIMNETAYPQLLNRVVMLRQPAMFRVVLNLARPFLSKGTLEKLTTCNSRTGQTDCAECPFIKRCIAAGIDAPNQVPKSVGGKVDGSAKLAI